MPQDECGWLAENQDSEEDRVSHFQRGVHSRTLTNTSLPWASDDSIRNLIQLRRAELISGGNDMDAVWRMQDLKKTRWWRGCWIWHECLHQKICCRKVSGKTLSDIFSGQITHHWPWVCSSKAKAMHKQELTICSRSAHSRSSFFPVQRTQWPFHLSDQQLL